jgi:hypothetical protein
VNNKKNYFYYISGSTPDSGNESPIVRFYFNQQPKGSPELIKQITNYFNLHQVPFTFKCCQNIADYNRTDSAVLYVAYNYFAISIQLLEKIIAQVKQFLNKEVPLFSLQLTDGFSFAENPFENLSFGQSRCNIIAVGICNCVTKKIKKENWADSILEKLIEEGLNPEKMYLNPSSVYNYNFALANFK